MKLRDQIIESEKQLIDAMLKADVQKLGLLIHDSLIFSNYLGLLITKEQDLESYRSGDLRMKRILITDLQMQEYGDVVIVTTIKELQGHYQDQEFNGTFRFLRTWKKVNDSWQIIAGSSVALS